STRSVAIFTLSLHDALPISRSRVVHPPRTRTSDATQGRHRSIHVLPAPLVHSGACGGRCAVPRSFASSGRAIGRDVAFACRLGRSEEHTSELQSRENLGCRL